MKLLVVGYLVPDEVVEELCRSDRMPPMQTHRFMQGFIQSLDSAMGGHVDAISAVPTNDYPHGRRIWVGFSRWTGRRKALWWGMPFINVFPLKHLTRFLSTAVMTATWCMTHLFSKKCLVVVSAATPQLAASWLVARLFGAKLVPCLMDPPSVDLAMDSGMKSRARQVDRRIADYVLARSDAAIAVTKPLGCLLVPDRPVEVFEGTAPPLPSTTADERTEARFVSAYAGALAPAYGLTKLLQAYELLDPSQHTLWVFGKGDGEEAVIEAAKRNPHIQYFGFVTSGLDERLKSTDLLLMVRPSQGDDSAYVFPSKILYSMALGVPTAVTRLQAIPASYFSVLYEIDDGSPAEIADSIRRIAAIPSEQRQERAEATLRFATEVKSPRAVGKALFGFLNSVVGDDSGRARSS